jgi:hypothetical protein
MTIEDRIRRVLADAVANEPPLRGAPVEAATRRRRRRPVLAGVVAMVLVLAAVVALAAVRGQGRPPAGPPTTTAAPATTVSTAGWPAYVDRAHNLRLRYPPGWKLRPGPGGEELVPPEYAASKPGWAKYAVTVAAFPGFYLSGYPWWGATRGRLPGGQAYVHTVGYPDRAPWEDPPASPATARGRRSAVYWVDWGRFCSTGPKTFGPKRFCGAHTVRVTVGDANARAFERYRATLDAIVRSAAALRPAPPSTDGLGRPACRPDQWRLAGPYHLGGSANPQRIFFSGIVRYRSGPACHLRLALRMTVERDGRPLPVAGSPATATVQGLLPDDDPHRLNKLGVHSTPLMWEFGVDEWCNRDLAGATLRVTAEGGGQVEQPLPGPSPAPARRQDCRDRGRPASVAGLP